MEFGFDELLDDGAAEKAFLYGSMSEVVNVGGLGRKLTPSRATFLYGAILNTERS